MDLLTKMTRDGDEKLSAAQKDSASLRFQLANMQAAAVDVLNLSNYIPELT